MLIMLTNYNFANAQLNTQDLVVTIKDIRTHKLENSDLMQIKLRIQNDGNDEVRLYSNHFGLFDSQLRKYAATSSYDLEEQGETVPRGICRAVFGEGANPGLSFDTEVCFAVPKTNFQYDSLIIYENMIAQSTKNAKIVPLVDNSVGYRTFVEKIQPEDENLAMRAEEVESSGGCLIATAAYGTELTHEVQNLRDIRNKLYKTESGNFMKSINGLYYSFSPTVADWERENPAFRETVKIMITPAMVSFTILDHNGIETDSGLVGYVTSVVLLNIGMYFVSPAVIIYKLRNRNG